MDNTVYDVLLIVFFVFFFLDFVAMAIGWEKGQDVFLIISFGSFIGTIWHTIWTGNIG